MAQTVLNQAADFIPRRLMIVANYMVISNIHPNLAGKVNDVGTIQRNLTPFSNGYFTNLGIPFPEAVTGATYYVRIVNEDLYSGVSNELSGIYI